MCRSDVALATAKPLAALLVAIAARLAEIEGADFADVRIGPVDFGPDGNDFQQEENETMTAITVQPADAEKFDYGSLTCGLLGCGADLHVEWRLSRPLFVGDVKPGSDLPSTEDAYTASWQVVCEKGHVLLVPGPDGCPLCGSDDDGECRHDDFDGSEENRTFRSHDLTRLRSTLAAFHAAASEVSR